MKNYYEILNVNKNSSPNEIKDSYKKLALKYHPDKNNNSKESEEKFKEISEAYNILIDKEKKRQYDMGGNIIIENNNPFDIFNNMFNHNHMFNHGGVSININNMSNISVGTSVNTTTKIIGNKKIIRIEKTEHTPNGTVTHIEEKIEII